MSDPISDMLTRIRNAVSARHARVDMPASRLKAEIARILQDEGYIHGFKLVEEAPAKGEAARPLIRIFLKYGPHGERVISGIERISRPGRRVYLGVDDVPATPTTFYGKRIDASGPVAPTRSTQGSARRALVPIATSRRIGSPGKRAARCDIRPMSDSRRS